VRLIFLHSAREWSGTARAFGRAGAALAERGWKVTLLAPADSNVELGLSVRRKKANGEEHDLAYDVIAFDTGGFWFFAARRLRKLFRRWDLDAVFVTTDREHLIAATTCWLARRGSVVRRTPTGVRLEMSLSGRIASRLANTVYLFASESDRNAAVVPLSSLTSAVAELGVNVEDYPHDESPTSNLQEPDSAGRETPKYIVCVYDPSSRGRAATAIRCISMLAPRHPALRLLIVGAGSDHEDLRMQASALRILHLVSFLGERDDQVALMRDAVLGWVVAEGDTAAYGILDLMALAKPLLASEAGVAQHYVANGISGTLYPVDDSAATAAAVSGLLAHEENRLAMGRAARTRVARDFSESGMVEGFAQAAEIAQRRTRRKGAG